jgi:hypothetical protein
MIVTQQSIFHFNGKKGSFEMKSITNAVSRAFRIAAVGLMAGVLFGATEFTADFAEVKGPKTSAGKIYFKDGKVRREVTQGKPAILIYRPDKDVMWDLNLTTRAYLELPGMGHMPTTIPEIQSALKGLGEFKPVGEKPSMGTGAISSCSPSTTSRWARHTRGYRKNSSSQLRRKARARRIRC